MSSTTATTSAPKPVETSAKPAQAGARPQDRKSEGDDIFASLLSLLANTQVLPEATTVASTAPGDGAANDSNAPGGTRNPLAALMEWGLPGSAADVSGKKPGAAGDGKIDISDMTPVEPTPLETAPKGAVAAPANAARPGHPFAPTVRASDAVATHTPGMQWRHASQASTETLALQQAANQAAQATPVRSTVALNERFGLAPGAPILATEVREAASEGFMQTTSAVAGGRAPEAATALPGAVAGDSATGSDSSGSDASAFDQADAQADHPLSDANAGEEPTVTHWGTQHLRHASLRVGEAGEQAIDIQLSMKGQEVQVEFKTDSAEARASLRENAGESLADLLNKSGIQLGGVSVGAQGQPGSRGDAPLDRQNGLRGVAAAANTPTMAPARPVHLSPRADGSQPLDVFA